MAASKNLTPEQRAVRAREAAKARTSIDHYVEKIVESASALTPEQIERLRSLLPIADGAA